MKKKGPRVDLRGQRFGRLVVTELAGYSKKLTAKWLCVCDCGGQRITETFYLRKGVFTQCSVCVAARPFRGLPLTQDRLKQLVVYAPDTGLFTRKLACANGFASGGTMGCVTERGYVQISIDRKVFLAHRLAWLYVTGLFPELFVDHINHDRSDNRWANLREATKAENRQNACTSSRNKTGFRGVWRCKDSVKWFAQIGVGVNRIYLGSWDTKEEAAAAYDIAADVMYGEIANPNLKSGESA